MASFEYLLAFVALALVASLRVEADLAGSCTDINIFTKDMDDTEEIFSFAKKHLLLEIDPTTVPYRLSLIRAWDRAIHQAKCSSNSFEDLVVLARCHPETDGGLRSLDEAFVRYIKKCFPTVDLAKRIRAKTPGSISNLFSGDATKFIDSQFINDFRKSNPHDVAIHIATQGGDNCCSPSDAASAIAKAIERKYPHTLKNFSTVAGELLDEENLAGYLEKDLFKPCKKYAAALFELMHNIFEIGKFISGNDAFLISQTSPEAQEGAFRYKLCKRLQDEYYDKETRDELVKRVFEKISFQK